MRRPARREAVALLAIGTACLVRSAPLGGASAASFLGTQGDVWDTRWDTRWDMVMALVGAVTAQLLLARRHDRELARLDRGQRGVVLRFPIVEVDTGLRALDRVVAEDVVAFDRLRDAPRERQGGTGR